MNKQTITLEERFRRFFTDPMILLLAGFITGMLVALHAAR